MANSLDKDLNGKTVILRNMAPGYEGIRFVVNGGFGASPNTMGTGLFGTFEDGEQARMHGMDVDRIVEDLPLDEVPTANFPPYMGPNDTHAYCDKHVGYNRRAHEDNFPDCHDSKLFDAGVREALG